MDVLSAGFLGLGVSIMIVCIHVGCGLFSNLLRSSMNVLLKASVMIWFACCVAL